MDAKQIENQIAANQLEAARIQSQLLQMDINNPQRQPLSGRLEMINRSQTYWANEYFKLTGQNITIPPIKISVKSTLPSPPAPTPPIPGIPPDNLANKLDEWKAIRLKIKTALMGNPRAYRVETYLDIVERNAGNKAPQINDMIVFGNAVQGSHGGQVENFNGTPMSNSCFSFEDSEAIVLSPDGSIMTPTKGTLMVVYRNRQSYENKALPQIEVHGTDLNEALKVMRGE